MKPPLSLMAAAIMFWGWQTALLPVAGLLAGILVSSRFLSVRWDFTTADFKRIADICTLLFTGVLIWSYLSERSPSAVFSVICRLPALYAPLLICQIFSTREQVDIRALSMLFRKMDTRPKDALPLEINLAWPYLLLAVVSAGAANNRSLLFFVAAAALLAWPLWIVRRPGHPFLWGFLLAAVFMLGYAGQAGLNRLQGFLEKKGMEWFERSLHVPDPFKTTTVIGDLEEIKLKSRILFRVEKITVVPIPLLLREALYNRYLHGTWFAFNSPFEAIPAGPGQSSWQLLPDTGSQALIIHTPLVKGQGLLKLPPAAGRVDHLPAAALLRNGLGTHRVETRQGFISYQAWYRAPGSVPGPPAEDDLMIPDQEIPALDEALNIMGIRSDAHLAADEVIRRIETFFNDRFTYSLHFENPGKKQSALAHFLGKARAGHCEYFATAAVLLLRRARIPARYVTGYSVQEFSRLEKKFIVRERHAHAWAAAFSGGRWQDVDTTPPDWGQAESKGASVLQPVFDAAAWIGFMFSRWRWQADKKMTGRYAAGLVVILVILAARGLSAKKGKKTASASDPVRKAARNTGKEDAGFYAIERHLNQKGFFRHPGETPMQWLARLKPGGENLPPAAVDALKRILPAYYRFRFDPCAALAPSWEHLQSRVQSRFRQWLNRYGQ